MKKLFCIVFVIIFSVVPFNTKALSTSAKGAILINGDTGEVIYQHNADVKLPMASTTKIMTALLLCENGDFNREITVTAEMLRVEGSSMGLLAGDRVTFHDLLYGLMLASGNDAANVVAFVLGGTVNGFVNMMNRKGRELGLENTNFVTPSGLDGEEHYTTARDLAKLARYAMQMQEFAKAAASKSAVLNYGNPPYRRSLTNHNKLLQSFEGAVGVKTGFTKKSGRCLVSAAKRDGKYVIAVTLNDPDDWLDHKNMLSYGLDAIKQTEILPKTAEYQIPVIGGEASAVSVKVEPYIVNSLETEGFTCEINLPRFVYAPVTAGDKLGSAVYRKNDTVIEKVALSAENGVDSAKYRKKATEKILENIKYIFKSLWEK